MHPLSDEELDRLLDGMGDGAGRPWWREYADVEMPADPADVPDEKRLCFAEEDKATSPYYPEVEPPALPPEAREAGVSRADLEPVE